MRSAPLPPILTLLALSALACGSPQHTAINEVGAARPDAKAFNKESREDTEADQREARKEDIVQKSALLMKLLGTTGGGGHAALDILSSGDAQESLDAALSGLADPFGGDDAAYGGIIGGAALEPPVMAGIALDEVALSGPGKLERVAVERVVERRLDDLQRCFGHEADQNAALGEIAIQLTFTVALNGQIADVELQGETSEGFRECVLSAMEGARFPSPSRGAVAVTQTLRFTPER